MTVLFQYCLHWLSHYHNKSFCDAVLAAVAVLSIAGPVVSLTVELSLSLIVPVTQDTATFTAPMMRGGKQRSDRKVRMQSKVTVADILNTVKTKEKTLLDENGYFPYRHCDKRMLYNIISQTADLTVTKSIFKLVFLAFFFQLLI